MFNNKLKKRVTALENLVETIAMTIAHLAIKDIEKTLKDREQVIKDKKITKTKKK